MHTASGATPIGSAGRAPNSQQTYTRVKKLTWLKRESGVEVVAVKSTRGTVLVRSKEGVVPAAALEPATSTATPAPGKGNLDGSSCSVRLEVISITGAGDLVGCWLLTTKV